MREGGELFATVRESDSPTVSTPAIQRIVDPKDYDFGSKIDGRTRSGKMLAAIAEEFSALPEWADLTESDRLSKIVGEVVARTGAKKKLVSAGARNALHTVKRFREIVRPDA